MKFTKAIKVRLYPNRTQEKQLNITLGHCRFVYNQMLSRQQKAYQRRGEHLSYNEMQNLLPVMKQHHSWLRDADSQALKYACRQVDNAYQKMFKEHSGKPKFKNKRGKQSYTTTNPTSIHIDFEQRKVKLPLLGWIKCRGLRPLPNDAIIKRATVTKDTDGKFYCSITYTYEQEINYTLPQNPVVIGLDYKISGLYVDSNGNSSGKPKHYTQSHEKLAIEQYKLSQKKGSKKHETKSKRYLKQQQKVNKVHKHIANLRKDFLHKQSIAIAKQYDVVCIEDISMKDMYATYTEANNHTAEHNINTVVADDGWYLFTQMLEYKLKGRGKQLIKVAKDYPSTETCSCCGHMKKIPLTKRSYHCDNCGLTLNRDHNTAINIKNEGMRLLKTA